MRPLLLLILTFISYCALCAAQEMVEHQQIIRKPARHSSRLGIGVKMSTLGAGVEFATRVTARSNLRTAFNVFTYGRPFDTEGITFQGELNLRSAQVNFDWFPFGGAFHLSPGMLVYNGNKLIANLSIPSGRVLHSGANTFRSDPADPIRGNASITFQKFAPAFLLGWGNLIPRKPRHFSIPFEFGVVFHGQPDLAFSLTGKGCDPRGHHCASINSTSSGGRYIDDERQSINRDISSFKFYPVISAGFAVNF